MDCSIAVRGQKRTWELQNIVVEIQNSLKIKYRNSPSKLNNYLVFVIILLWQYFALTVKFTTLRFKWYVEGVAIVVKLQKILQKIEICHVHVSKRWNQDNDAAHPLFIHNQFKNHVIKGKPDLSEGELRLQWERTVLPIRLYPRIYLKDGSHPSLARAPMCRLDTAPL